MFPPPLGYRDLVWARGRADTAHGWVDMLRSSGLCNIVKLTALKASMYQTPSGYPELRMWRPVAVLWFSNSRPGPLEDLRRRIPPCFYLERGLQMAPVAAECLTVLNQASVCAPVRFTRSFSAVPMKLAGLRRCPDAFLWALSRGHAGTAMGCNM